MYYILIYILIHRYLKSSFIRYDLINLCSLTMTALQVENLVGLSLQNWLSLSSPSLVLKAARQCLSHLECVFLLQTVGSRTFLTGVLVAYVSVDSRCSQICNQD